MFDPMHAGNPIWSDLLLGLALVLALAGFYWIYRITKDIEDS